MHVRVFHGAVHGLHSETGWCGMNRAIKVRPLKRRFQQSTGDNMHFIDRGAPGLPQAAAAPRPDG